MKQALINSANGVALTKTHRKIQLGSALPFIQLSLLPFTKLPGSTLPSPPLQGSVEQVRQPHRMFLEHVF